MPFHSSLTNARRAREHSSLPERLKFITVDLLIKISCLVKKINVVSVLKSKLSVVSTNRSTVLTLPVLKEVLVGMTRKSRFEDKHLRRFVLSVRDEEKVLSL